MLMVNQLAGFGAGAASSGATLYSDTFTDTNGTQLSAHTSESGHTYTDTIHYPSAYTTLEIQSNYLTQPTTPARSAHALINGFSLAGGGNKLSLDVTLSSSSNYSGVGIIVNWSGSGATRSGLWILYDSDSRLSVLKQVNGVESTVYDNRYVTGDRGRKLKVRRNVGDTYTIEIYLSNDSLVTSYTTASASSLGIGTGEGVGFGFYASNGVIPIGLQAYEE